MEVLPQKLSGVCLLKTRYFTEERGYFTELYSKRTFQEAGLDYDFIQDNHSYTAKKNTIRGIHFQKNPMVQTKLVRCVRGRVMDVVVDLRKDSATYLQWDKFELSSENKLQLLVPRGFGHGFITLEDDCEFFYKVDAFYSPEDDRSIAWNDPEIGVDWGITTPILSEKDEKAPLFQDSDVDF